MTAMRKKIECCRNCENRTPDCHATCDDYRRENEELNEYRAVIRADKTAADQLREYHKTNWKRRNPKKPLKDGGRKP